MDFKQLGLIAPILKALQAEGYTEPTPIQRGAIPPALSGRDVLGCAQTGTGKTCAFAAPILQRLNGKNGNPRVVKALILTPTRELAIQIGECFQSYGRNLSLRCAVIFGGVGQAPQVEALRKGLDILVATPGRLLDLQGQGLLDLSHIEVFVLDEADRMLDMGFIHDVRKVLKLLPEKKQTLFFSATMPPEVMDLVNGLLHDYARVTVDPVSSPVEVIRQSLYYVDRINKTRLLAYLLDRLDIPSVLVFSRTKHGANRVARDLERLGIRAAAIHGNKSQTARVQALGDFKAGELRVLVATDIAARGIDIEDLPCVLNYNLPDVPETYVHRIGRTGRAGKGGMAISFCEFGEKEELKAIEKLLGKPIPVVEDHPYPMENFDPPMKDRHGRPVNPEDQEAREAARQRKRERDAAKAQVMGSLPPPAGRGEAVKAPKPAPKPVYPKSQPAARGTRRGRLEDTLPSDPAMPSSDFVKPNPLDSDVVMDATARLLTPRKSAQGGSQPKRQSSGANRSSRRTVPEGEKKPMSVPQPAPAGRKRRRRNGLRPVERPLSASRQKDSTEHKSLMRPYYIEHDD